MQQKQTTKAPLTFRRYCRGGWAIMDSLHRLTRIGVLSVAMLSTAQVQSSGVVKSNGGHDSSHSLEADTLQASEMDELTVTGSMAPLTALQSARIVTVISRDEINRAAAQTVNDLLKSVAGIDVRQRGGFSVQTDISIDGGTFDQVCILLNGVDITSPQTGHHSAHLPVSPSDIERIEVLEGAAGRTYAGAAFGGAINIVTRDGIASQQRRDTAAVSRSWSVEAGAQGGSYGTFGADVRGAWQGQTLSSTYLRSDGGTVNSDFQTVNAYYSGHHRGSALTAHWQAGLATKRYGANTFYSAAFPNQWEEESRYIVSASLSTHGRVPLTATAHWQRSTDHFQLVRSTSRGENFHCGDVFGAELKGHLKWGGGTTAAGIDVRNEGVLSTNLGRPLDTPQGRYTHRDNRTQLSYAVEHNLLLSRFTLSAGVRAVMNTAVGTRFGFYPGIDMAYRLGSSWRMFASYNKGLRMPTFTDLYYKSPTQEGNVGLRPEVSHSTQMGVEFRRRNVGVTAKAFYHRGHRMIDWVMRHETDVYHSTAFDLDNLGGSLSCNLRLPHDISLRAGYTFIHQWRHDTQQVFKSNYALEYLRHKFTATFMHPVWSHLRAAWDFRLCDRRGNYIEQVSGSLVPYRPYAVADVKLEWEALHYTVWVSAQNLTATRYHDFGNISQPGLWVMAGARVRF